MALLIHRVMLVLGMVLGSLGLVACDQQRVAQLEEGVATEADVRKQFGEPAAIYNEADGGRVFDYPRQPEGRANYMITIGPDGKMSALRQVLKPAEFAKVTPGLDKAQVRRLIGPPAKTQRFDLKPDEENWDWRWMDNQQPKVFTVTFDKDGKVMTTAVVDDPNEQKGG
jgi:outer membrane protein assembly factor BamE (lipoprotein component of BamABCDE complex)